MPTALRGHDCPDRLHGHPNAVAMAPGSSGSLESFFVDLFDIEIRSVVGGNFGMVEGCHFLARPFGVVSNRAEGFVMSQVLEMPCAAEEAAATRDAQIRAEADRPSVTATNGIHRPSITGVNGKNRPSPAGANGVTSSPAVRYSPVQTVQTVQNRALSPLCYAASRPRPNHLNPENNILAYGERFLRKPSELR